MDAKIIGSELFLDRWVYGLPSLTSDKDGNIVIISKVSFGPAEAFCWGIDSGGKPYEMYKWCENDLYEDENYMRNITFSELFRRLDELVKTASESGFSDWARSFVEARGFLENLSQTRGSGGEA